MRIRAAFISLLLTACSAKDYRTADRSSAGIAPKPEEEPEAVVQIYAARAFSWRGIFSVHCWIATKETKAEHYLVYHVSGWRLQRDKTSVSKSKDIPDRRWFGAEPSLVFELRGEEAAQAIPKIESAVQSYPHADAYTAWPGPNSNTFVSYIIRQVPELGVELPPHAIGKDWLVDGNIISKSETGTGGQFSFFGILGLTLGLGEGIEINIFGLNFGVDFLRPALKLPFIGRLGVKDKSVF